MWLLKNDKFLVIFLDRGFILQKQILKSSTQSNENTSTENDDEQILFFACDYPYC